MQRGGAFLGGWVWEEKRLKFVVPSPPVINSRVRKETLYENTGN
jgi:hypothetical protein